MTLYRLMALGVTALGLVLDKLEEGIQWPVVQILSQNPVKIRGTPMERDLEMMLEMMLELLLGKWNPQSAQHPNLVCQLSHSGHVRQRAAPPMATIS